jgi:hypothetical protein
LEEVFAADDPAGTLQAVRKVKEQLRLLLRTGSLEDAAAATAELEKLVKASARPEVNRLYRTVYRLWKEIEVLIITGTSTGEVEGNNTAIKTSNTPLAVTATRQLQIAYSLEKCSPGGGHDAHSRHPFTHESRRAGRVEANNTAIKSAIAPPARIARLTTTNRALRR